MLRGGVAESCNGSTSVLRPIWLGLEDVDSSLRGVDFNSCQGNLKALFAWSAQSGIEEGRYHRSSEEYLFSFDIANLHPTCVQELVVALQQLYLLVLHKMAHSSNGWTAAFSLARGNIRQIATQGNSTNPD